MTTASPSLVVRSGSGTSYGAIGTALFGEFVLVIEVTSSGWAKIDANGQYGYVSAAYLGKS
ncbi:MULTISPECIES: SH3 domain-containing protein [Desulfitobacterium]|uniref:SH3 domain-containing protein n=1 Tax=Desulfitobacterium TaxID=36853 RepID=UPI0009323155